ncbi:uncharacterized protein MKK02DRAFT_44540 [Dioszegia hungarica]|uniref:F-box domain-containing protein n=1 Tax=Dioszegia hungarica TaxID=4972 RepID=A0AA38HBA8_9TREE|nr:uncharacterized protein MKK02DRAFT_44540 [Dioszegia hungarica]KAI9635844.1 hypothetical protein MKK02DRAFT_44540 [Dioszegia hungarica]
MLLISPPSSSLSNGVTSQRQQCFNTPSGAILPAELLLRIATILAQSHQFRSLGSLARTSTSLNLFVTPLIYRDVYIHSKADYESILTALSQSASTADGADGQASGRGGIMGSLRLTKRVTIRDLPHPHFGPRLSAALARHHETVLFPNAEFLAVAPLQPYLHPPADKAAAARGATSPLPFLLSQLCTPDHLCLDHLFGPSADIKLSRNPCCAFLHRLTSALPRGSWAKHAQPTLSWHGPLKERSGVRPADFLSWERAVQQFDHVRIYSPSDIRLNVDDFTRTHGQSPPNLVGAWAATLAEGLCRSGLCPVVAERPTMYTLNIATSGRDAPEASATRLGLAISTNLSNGSLALRKSALLCIKACMGSISQLCLDTARANLEPICQRLSTPCSDTGRSTAGLISLLHEAQEQLNRALEESPLVDREDIHHALVSGELARLDPAPSAWRVEGDLGGKGRLRGIDVRIGQDQVPCPVLSYCPY